MDDRYLLISADGHAGPPAEVYRDHLDPAYRDAFDEHQAQLTALREAMLQDTAFREEWERRTGDGGLTAAYDSAARNEKLDGEGVAAEVLFPDADVLGTGRPTPSMAATVSWAQRSTSELPKSKRTAPMPARGSPR